MHTALLLGVPALIAGSLCLVLTPLFRNLFIRLGFVDNPDSDRKFHANPVPRVGGVPIAVSYSVALFLQVHFNLGGGRVYVQHQALFHQLLPAAGLIFLTGLLDDLIGLKPWQKLLGQGVAASLAIAFGARLSFAHVPTAVSVVLSAIWLIGCTNAVNLIDGMDGLATGMGLMATLTTLMVALVSGNLGLALATVPLAAALLAFLRYNFHPASVFLGDCGSLTIGFVLGCFGLVWSQHTGTLLGMVAPLLALALPLIDVSLAVGRRFLRAVPIFQGDRGHIHHRVLDMGFNTRDAALLLYGVCAVAALLALLESFSHGRLVAPILLVFCALVLVGVRRLKYIELSAMRKVLRHALMRSSVQEHIYLDELERELAEVVNVEEWWAVVRGACRRLTFASVAMEWQGRRFREQLIPLEIAGCRISLELAHGGTLVLTRAGNEATPRMLMQVLEVIQQSLWQTPFCRALREQQEKFVSSNAA